VGDMRGYFGVGIYQPKHEVNIGTLFRSAHAFSADFLCTIGRRYREQASDTTKVLRNMPVYNYLTIDDLYEHLPIGCEVVCVELTDDATPLTEFRHPHRCLYLLGAEDNGLPPKLTTKHKTVIIPHATMCLNVATAGTIVMYDRLVKA
jgi:tRNA G18 (ribose-2'-O)-methylase SpoU